MSRDGHIHRILNELETQPRVSQRSLATRLGIALGLTNLLLRRLAAKGWIRIVKVRPNHVRYLLTPAGLAHKAALSRDYLQNAIRFYGEARDRVQVRFAEMLRQTNGAKCDAVVFFGAGEVAEVGYVCLQRLPLRLVGVVDDDHTGQDFFGLSVRGSDGLTRTHCHGAEFDRIIVMSFANVEKVRHVLDKAGVPADRVFWV